MIFFPLSTVKIPLSPVIPRYSPSYPLKFAFFLVNHRIFPPTKQLFIYLPPPPGGKMKKIHPCIVPYHLIFFSFLSFLNLDFLSQMFNTLTPHDILPNGINIKGKKIFLPISLPSRYILPHTLDITFSSYKLDILPQLDKLPNPPRREE